MKKLFTWMLLCTCTYSTLKAQLSDDFSDGNMSDDPMWSGDIAKFEIDASQKLHLNAPAVASHAYLSTASEAIGESEWSWDSEISENPSSTNFCKIYLTSDQAILDSPLNGYFIKIGGAPDEVSLYRQEDLSETLIIDGLDGRVNMKPVQVSVKVRRDMAGNWSLETKLAGESAFLEEGTAFDDTHTHSTYFGVYCEYTATRSTAFYFDNFLVSGVPIPDTTAPKLLSHLPSTSQEIKLSFSEPLLASSALQQTNYLLNGQQAESVSYADDTVRLTFSSPFPNAITQQLSLSGIADESNNFIPDTIVDIFYFEKVKAVWGSLVINEIFPDPTPSILTLPDESDAEFIEIYNPSLHSYELENWMVNGKPLPAFLLLPEQYIILCKPAYEEAFEAYGNTLSLSNWPTLSNSGGNVILSDDEASVIDSITYTSAEIAEGFSLEKIYLEAPCGGQTNLAISKDQNGATPGAKNTAFSDEADLSSPELLQITPLREDSLLLTFSEKTYLPKPYIAQISIEDMLYPEQVQYFGNDSSAFLVVFEKPLVSHTNHRLSIQEVYDCSGNTNNSIALSFYLDLQAPFIEQLIVLDTAEILVVFSEKLLKASAEKESNYTIYPFEENPKKALLEKDSLSMKLTFPSTFNIQDTVTLSIQQLEDFYENSIPSEYPLSSSFIYNSQIDSVYVINDHQIDIKFKLAPDATSALNALNYAIDRSVGNPARVITNANEPQVVHLLLQNPLSPNKQHTLTVSNLLDEKNHLISTPLYPFFYDTRGPMITEVKTIDVKELIIFFDEAIYVNTEQKLSVWIGKDTVAIESYDPYEKHIRLKLASPLVQEKNYVISIEGISDIQSNFSNPTQNYAFLMDQVPPRLDTAFVYSPHELMLIFHEPVLIEGLAAKNYLHLIQPSYIPVQAKFYQLAPESVLFSFEEVLNVNLLHFQISNFSDQQQNRMTSPIEHQIALYQPAIGHIVPLSNYHLRLYFTSDIQNLGLNRENFMLNGNLLPDSLSFSSAHQLDLWFSHPFGEFADYQLSFNYTDTQQNLSFQYQDFVENVAHDGNSTVKIQFSVPLEASVAEHIENYKIESHGHPLAAIYIPEAQSVQLLFKGEIDRKILHSILIQGLLTIDHFPLPQSEHFFGIGRAPAYQELLITEMMVKPTPSVALPEAEYIEILNASNYPLQLQGIKLADAQKTVSLNEKWLSPGEHLILCGTHAVASLSAYGNCMGIRGFPNLNDETDTIRMLNASGHEIHKVSYSEDWYNDAGKKNGGWSLEMIDTAWPCQGMYNWRASVSPVGGTPGTANSVQQSNPDLQAPALLQAVADDSLYISLTFNEKLHNQVVQDALLTLEGIAIENTSSYGEHQLKIRLSSPLQAGTTYKLTLSHIADCSGNFQQEAIIADIILPDYHQRNDILVSEILFHTRSGGVDFVEVYNHSDKLLNLKNWKLATQMNEAITNISLISTEALILAPGEYLAITEDKNTLLADYPSALKGNIFESQSFPSLLSNGGTLLLMDGEDHIMQKIDFSPDWHHPLLQEKRSVSLERTSWNVDENDRQYWQSAAANVGYATPGYQNSQWQNLPETTHALQIDPPIFYPDQSGYQDYTRIRFQFEGVGNIGNLKIFDARGRMIRQLVHNQSLSEEGFFTWDGTDDFKKRAHIGYYIIWMEVFRPDGSVNVLKSKVVVGSKF